MLSRARRRQSSRSTNATVLNNPPYRLARQHYESLAAEVEAQGVDNLLLRVPVRQWVLLFPIPLRSLFAVHPELLTPVLRITHRAINTHRIKQTGVKRQEAVTGAITFIQRFGSAANLNIHLHALVLDGVYQTSGDEGAPVFHEGAAPGIEARQTLLRKIIKRILKLLTRLGHLTEEDDIVYLARADSADPDNLLAPLQDASTTWRIALGPRAGRKVLTLVGGRGEAHSRDSPCANADGFSLHAGVRCETNERQAIEQLCRYFTCQAISNECLAINREGNVVPRLKGVYRGRGGGLGHATVR